MDLFPSFVWCIKYCALQKTSMIWNYVLINQAMPTLIAFKADLRRNVKNKQATKITEVT